MPLFHAYNFRVLISFDASMVKSSSKYFIDKHVRVLQITEISQSNIFSHINLIIQSSEV